LLAAIGLIFGVLGYAGGAINHARQLYNKTIDDAKKIKRELEALAQVNKKMRDSIQASMDRNKRQLGYDQTLVDELDSITQAFTPQAALARQQSLFKTNYGLMEDLAINRLFTYYNDSLQLVSAVTDFVRNAKATKELLISYQKDVGESGQRKYGIVISEDKGSFYIGSLVEIGLPWCSETEAKPGECPLKSIKGFRVRSGSSSWDNRAGKPKKKDLSEIVIPIRPDENWRQVAVGKKGYLAYKQYVMDLRSVDRLTKLLLVNEKPLLQDLSKAAGKPKQFSF
jgi:hypothetical protein